MRDKYPGEAPSISPDTSAIEMVSISVTVTAKALIGPFVFH